MIKKEIVEKISSYFKITEFEAEKIYDDIFSTIIDGVKEDNISEVEKLGEFISRSNIGGSGDKTVEFLASHFLEDEIKYFNPLVAGISSSEQVKTSGSSENVLSSQNVEDELRKKREEILNKINAPAEITSAESNIPVQGNVTNEIENETKKSFSDYFAEVKESVESPGNKEVPVVSAITSGIQESLPPVVPPSAVELHKEITGEIKKEQVSGTESKVITNGNGYEHKNPDNSYYIWYRDSEPNQTDTQTMSYEYELLYQATKEAEYKSKLRVYVTTFILFFSIVLLLLIFSPVIYRYFFTPAEETQEVIEETSVNDETINPISPTPPTQENNPPANTPHSQITEQKQNPESKTVQPDNQVSSTQPQNPVQSENTAPPVTSSQQIEGVTRNSMGWMDEKNKVIYVQLENGKYTIQESAWDSDAKANKRVSAVSAFLPGLKGNVVKADLGSKGTWYRARFGEFTTLEEARKKAEELRSKEKIKLQAYLLSFFFFA
ncbi:MAG: SPOR domain-containing protein [Ignavibacteria bacterium]|nr:SPOR domain-containing protein [Ignavibacteria bacterium]